MKKPKTSQKKLTLPLDISPRLLIGTHPDQGLYVACYSEIEGGGTEIGGMLAVVAATMLQQVAKRADHTHGWLQEERKKLVDTFAASLGQARVEDDPGEDSLSA